MEAQADTQDILLPHCVGCLNREGVIEHLAESDELEPCAECQTPTRVRRLWTEGDTQTVLEAGAPLPRGVRAPQAPRRRDDHPRPDRGDHPRESDHPPKPQEPTQEATGHPDGVTQPPERRTPPRTTRRERGAHLREVPPRRFRSARDALVSLADTVLRDDELELLEHAVRAVARLRGAEGLGESAEQLDPHLRAFDTKRPRYAVHVREVGSPLAVHLDELLEDLDELGEGEAVEAASAARELVHRRRLERRIRRQ